MSYYTTEGEICDCRRNQKVLRASCEVCLTCIPHRGRTSHPPPYVSIPLCSTPHRKCDMGAAIARVNSGPNFCLFQFRPPVPPALLLRSSSSSRPVSPRGYPLSAPVVPFSEKIPAGKIATYWDFRRPWSRHRYPMHLKSQHIGIFHKGVGVFSSGSTFSGKNFLPEKSKSLKPLLTKNFSIK